MKSALVTLGAAAVLVGGAAGARSAAPPGAITLKVGQVVHVQGTSVDCAVVRSGTGAGKPTIYCSKDDKTGPIPGTFATLLSDDVAAAGKIQPSRRTTIVWQRNQP